METIAAREAKNHFGELMDKVQRMPVLIEKHGRPAAIILSFEEYKKIKLEKLKSILEESEQQLKKNQFTEVEVEELNYLFQKIKTRAKNKTKDNP